MTKKFGFLKSSLTALAMVGIVIPQTRILAEQPRRIANQPVKVLAANTVLDIRLSKEGTLAGRVLDHAGTPMSGTQVQLKHGKSIIADSVTDEKGEFAVSNLKTGVYQISSGKTDGIYRIWSEKTAPPSAKPCALIVQGENGARGQVGSMGTTEVFIIATSLAALGLGTAALIIANDAKDKSNQAVNAQNNILSLIVPASP